MQLELGHALRAGALLFDMDGTLVDSTAVVMKVWRRFAARHGLDAEQFLADSHGRKTEDTVKRVATPGMDVAAETRRICAEEIADRDGIVEIPGAGALIAALPRTRWAVVTSASRELAATRIRAAGLPLPETIICAEDVRRGKPDPEGYLAAARALGVPPAQCLVFEDARAGLEAGHAAGMQVLALATTLPAEALIEECWIRDYRDLRITPDETGIALTRVQTVHC
jgi:mannitol-1-/sugar-/sorbitol-6-phosphatase